MFNSALIYELAVLKPYVEALLFGIDREAPEYMEAKKMCIRDRAGTKAALRAMPILKDVGITARIIRMEPHLSLIHI